MFVLSDEDLLGNHELEYPRDHDTFIGFHSDESEVSVDCHDSLAQSLGVRPVALKQVQQSDVWKSESFCDF